MNRRHFFKWAILAGTAVQLNPLAIASPAPMIAPSTAKDVPAEFWEFAAISDKDEILDGRGDIAVAVFGPTRLRLTHHYIGAFQSGLFQTLGASSGQIFTTHALHQLEGLPARIAHDIPCATWLKSFPAVFWDDEGVFHAFVSYEAGKFDAVFFRDVPLLG